MEADRGLDRAGALRRALARLAADAPVRVFPLVGADPPGEVEDLRLQDDVLLVDSPRSANILLVAGDVPEPLHEPARRVHDAMAHPRLTLRWTHEPASPAGLEPFPEAVVVGASEELAPALRRAQKSLLAGRLPSEAALLPDLDPAPWRGVGPYGHGGSGMTGGVPYGRPMAERAADRDGIDLDQLPLRIGPFYPPLPTGLVLELKVQGDVIQEATVGPNAFGSPPAGGDAVIRTGAEDLAEPLRDPFRMALWRPVPIMALEIARAGHHLRWLAHTLRFHGLDALGRRALGLAVRLGREGPAALAGELTAIGRLLERTLLLGWATSGVGLVARERVSGLGLGPVARAAGALEDARLDEPAYRELDFAPIIQQADDGRAVVGDARARWRQRLAETIQSLSLAARAGARRAGGAGRIESPRGLLTRAQAPATRLLTLVPDLLRGAEWGDAMTTVVSLDLDAYEAAHGAPAAASKLPPSASARQST